MKLTKKRCEGFLKQGDGRFYLADEKGKVAAVVYGDRADYLARLFSRAGEMLELLNLQDVCGRCCGTGKFCDINCHRCFGTGRNPSVAALIAEIEGEGGVK